MNRKYLITLSILITIITIVGLSYAYFTAKTHLEMWYNDNFGASSRNASLAEYIVDGTFCNDKSFGDYSKVSYELSGSYIRTIVDKRPSYKCPIEKAPTLSTTTTTNKYTLKVGLITADEVAYAGGKSGLNESSISHWLDTEQYYWTLSPSTWGGLNARVMSVWFGLLGGVSPAQGSEFGLRQLSIFLLRLL